MARLEVVNNLHRYLAEMVIALRSGSAAETESCDTAKDHGEGRWYAGYDLKGVILEYGLLRSAIVEVLEETGVSPSVRAWDALSQFLNAGIADAAVEFTKVSAQQVHEALEQAQRATEAREDVLAIVSHDLKNPLQIIRSTAAVIGGELESADLGSRREILQSKVERIERAVERMNVLISDLLDLARMAAGELRLRDEEHRAEDLMREACEQAAPLAERRSIQLSREEASGGALVCDRERVLQVLANLIGNAIKFAPESSAVHLRASCTVDQCTFEVRDEGPGIPVERIPHLFDRFWRAPDSAGTGTGLGLSIAKGFVELHGGRIWVESKVGQGATFFFSLPRKPRF